MIVLSGSGVSTSWTYSDLQQTVINWTHREGDSAFAARIPDFIRLAEARFNRSLRTSAQTTPFDLTALVSGSAPLPAGFLAFKELRSVGATSYTLEPRPLEWISNQPASATAPQYYAIAGGEVLCWPGSGSIQGTYYAEIPALAAYDTNWLLASHPDLYLFATLTEAALFIQADDRIPLWADRAAKLLEAVQSQDNANALNGGPLQVRAR